MDATGRYGDLVRAGFGLRGRGALLMLLLPLALAFGLPGEACAGLAGQMRFHARGYCRVLGKSRGTGQSFEQQVEELSKGKSLFSDTLRALLAVLRSLGKQVQQLDRQAQAYAHNNPVCRHLMSIPGVGTITAAAFVTAVDDPGKFRKSRSVGAYFGLTPSRYQSGETDHNGRISKCGDGLVRTYLFEAATVLLTRVRKWSALKTWGLRLAKRGGMKKAIVAVARKLAVIMHQM